MKMPPLLSSGLKRKREVVDYEVTHGLQRQSILDISMIKLRTSPKRRIEPCLRRSVLILNTLKHIETELQGEGVNIHTSTEAAMNKIPEMSTADLTLDPLPDMSTFISPQPISVPMQLDGLSLAGSNTYFEKETSAVVDLTPCKPVYQSAETSFTQHSSSSGLTSLPSPVAMPKPHQAGDSNNNSVAQVPYIGSNMPLMDDPFSDIDISFDFDLMAWSSTFTSLPVATSTSASVASSSSSSTAALSSTKLLPSLSIEDILHSFPHPNFSSNLETPTSPALITPVLNSQCSTCCRTDSSLDDLENIMQILVGL